MIPFSKDVFLDLVARLNATFWPAEIATVLLGLLVLYLALWPRPRLARHPALFLAVAWLNVSVLYFGSYFTTLNWAAWPAAVLFALQGLLTLWFGVFRDRLTLRYRADAAGRIGAGCLVFAAVLYPLFGHLTGTGHAAMPMLAFAPGPTVLFTWGAFLLAADRPPLILLAIPFVWSFIGATAAYLIGLPADQILPPAALAGVWLIIRRRRET